MQRQITAAQRTRHSSIGGGIDHLTLRQQAYKGIKVVMASMDREIALDRAEAQRQLALGNAIEEILLTILELEEEWRLDDRIAYAVRHQR